ncbi:hypothetical protein AAVH_33353, partial [Aphelenchoides avenae]
MCYVSVLLCLLLMAAIQTFAADTDLPTCTSDQCESIMPGYRDMTVYVRPKAQDRYTYIDAETACLDLNATVVMAVDKRNR